MGVQLRGIAGTRGNTVPSKRVGKGDLEQVVISFQKTTYDSRQRVALRGSQVRQVAHGAARQEQGLERPDGPPGHDSDPVRVFDHDPLPGRTLERRVFDQEPLARVGPGPELLLLELLLNL